MASSRKKKRSVGRVVLILILCLALIAVIAVTVGYSLVARPREGPAGRRGIHL